MYEGFYHLKEDPFRLTPDPAYMCMTPEHREALSGLVYTVCTRPGLTVLVGEAGTGKTTVLYTLVELLEKRRFATAICTNPTLNRAEFYDLLMIKFGVECESPLKSRQLAALEEKLRSNHAEGHPGVLIIDEAQRLPVELLEEVRLLLNLETTREKLLEVILAGQPEILETLGRHEMRQLKQRVSCICKLKPLTRAQVAEVLCFRLAQAGLPSQSLFSEECIDLVHAYSHGIPRLMNTLCDSSLQVGFGLRSPHITPAIVEEAARDLELVKEVAEAEKPLAEVKSLPEAKVASPVAAAPPQPLPKNGTAVEDGVKRATSVNGNPKPAPPDEVKVPLQEFADRQKSMGVIAKLLEYWK